MASDPPDPEHLGYDAVSNAEDLLPFHKRWNSAASKFEKEARSFVERHPSVAKMGDHGNEIMRMLALPWTGLNEHMMRCYFYEDAWVLPDDLEQFVGGFWPDWQYLYRFRDDIKRTGGIIRRNNPPYHAPDILEACIEHQISWTEQDLALDAAISRLPLALRTNIEVSTIKGNYQLFLVAITNAFPIPEDRFDHHLRRYHTLKVAYAHINLLIEHFREEDILAATIPSPFRPYAWVMYNVIMRLLYHSRTFNPDNYLKDRTLYGWTTGLLWKWINACRTFRVGLQALRDDHDFSPGDDGYDLRMWAFGDVISFTEVEALQDKYDVGWRVFDDMIDSHERIDVTPEFIHRLRKAHEELRNVGLAAEILRVLPHSTDPTFLGLDDEPGEKDEIAQLYDRMRVFVDVREYAYCEEHGGIGDW